MDDAYADILESEGFHAIGGLNYRINLGVWWHPEAKLQVIVLPVGSTALIKGDKAYYLKSISEEGETWARDLPSLQDYLETHFPEIHLSFSHFRDITPSLAATQLRRKLSAERRSPEFSSVDQISRLQRGIEIKRTNLAQTERLLGLDSDSSDLLHGYVNRKVATLRRDIKQSKELLKKERERLSMFENLQREYECKASAAVYVFSIGSNVHVVDSPLELRDGLQSIVKELTDFHRYQVSQKLSGGKLNIHVNEASEPLLVWIEEWFGGALNPRQLTKVKNAFRVLDDATVEHTMITPKVDIQMDDAVREDRKLLAARVVSTIARRLDNQDRSVDLSDLGKEAKPATVGFTMTNNRISSKPAIIPLSVANHIYISGTTGSGKTYTGRLIVEEATRYQDLNILVLDPRNQAAGLLVPEDRESILSMYDDFGMKRDSARGFKFNYFAPGSAVGRKLPSDLSELSKGRSIVSFKSLDDKERCTLFTRILDSVFEAYVDEESESLRLIILIEEAQRFTKKRVSDDAKVAGQQAENALDRTVRESRKYGCCTIILSQTIRDFSYDSASIRQNTNTKVFLHNSDREIDYAADFIGNGRQIVRLGAGTAIVHNSAWGAFQVKVRPPLSKVWEFSAADTQRLVSSTAISETFAVSSEAQRLLYLSREYSKGNDSALNLTEAGKRLGIGSKRQLGQLVEELERNGLVRTRKLRQRGQPRIIEPLSSSAGD